MQLQINDKFAQLSNSLYVAERTARQEVAVRSQIQKNVTQREKAKREDMLRKLAEEARSNRGTNAPRDVYVPFFIYLNSSSSSIRILFIAKSLRVCVFSFGVCSTHGVFAACVHALCSL